MIVLMLVLLSFSFEIIHLLVGRDNLMRRERRERFINIDIYLISIDIKW